jgi:aminotransferase
MDIMRRVAETGAVDLAIGTPGFAPDERLVVHLLGALGRGLHQYELSAGVPLLRSQIVGWTQPDQGLRITLDDVTVTCGASEALAVALHTIVEPGDEVVVLEPGYEGFAAAARLAGGTVRVAALRAPTWALDISDVERIVTRATRAIIINTPNNPTGKVFTLKELAQIGALCVDRQIYCISDEVYRVFTDDRFVSALDVPDLAERTLYLGSFSKALAVSGWRIGFLITPPWLTSRARCVHQAISGGAPSAPQHAIATFISDGEAFREATDRAAAHVREQGLRAVEMFTKPELVPIPPQGGCFFLVELHGSPASAIAERLIDHHGVAVAPGTAFWSHRETGERFVRVAFNKSSSTIAEAARRLTAFDSNLGTPGPPPDGVRPPSGTVV